ncbi:dead end protein homolog 1-like [Mixophyes fleayi]|uniref:dead end protein homolog 1-like n=1 Tax=Mixophyes fleayi TaxID=3061075 RepID=UPI003F4E168E
MNGDNEVWVNSVNSKNIFSLMQWMQNYNVHLVQINGQRKYGGPPPGWVGGIPPYGSEIFIGNLPQEIYEDKLIPLFQSVGKLYEFRLMMTFSGLNRGFAYARYPTKHLADLAISHLSGHEIQCSYKIVVSRSTEKCELALDGIPSILHKEALATILNGLTAGVDTVSLYASATSDLKNVAIVKYRSHIEAAMAKKTICKGPQLLYGCPFTLDWLQPPMRQKLQSGTLPQPHSFLPQMRSDKPKQDKITLSGVQCLQLLCDQRNLGQPVYQIKLLSLGSCGWLRFWYLVVIPKHRVPFTGYSWMLADSLIPTDQYEQAKEMVAFWLLTELGYFVD